MKASLVGIFLISASSWASDRWADSVPSGPTYTFRGKVNDRIPERPQLIKHDKYEWRACQKFDGKPLPQNSERRLYRHIFLSSLQDDSKAILDSRLSDYLGYQDCMRDGVARPGSYLGDCEFKKKDAKKSLSILEHWRGSLYLANLQFAKPQAGAGHESLWSGEKFSGLPSKPLPFGSSPDAIQPAEMEKIQQRVSEIKKKIVTSLQKEAPTCFRIEGADLIPTDAFKADTNCAIKSSGFKDKAHRQFYAEAKKQLAKDTSRIIATEPWLAYIKGPGSDIELNRGFDQLIHEIEQGKKRIEGMKPGDLQSDKRIPLVASDQLVEGSLRKALEEEAWELPSETDIPHGLPPEQHRQFLCSAAQEILDEYKSEKRSEEIALFALGASGGLACFTSGLVPCIIIGGATAIASDGVRLRNMFRDRETNRQDYVSGFRDMGQTKETASSLESDIYQTILMMPAAVILPAAGSAPAGIRGLARPAAKLLAH